MNQTMTGPGPRRAITRELVERFLAARTAADRRAAAQREAVAAAPPPAPDRPPRVIGYARVSTDDQTTALQMDALWAAGCDKIHEEQISGAARVCGRCPEIVHPEVELRARV